MIMPLKGLIIITFYGFITLNFISADLRNFLFLLLLIISILNIKKLDLSVNKKEMYLLGSYLYIFLITLFFYFYHESPISDIDTYSRFLAVLPLYFLFKHIVLKPNDFVIMLVITSIATAILSSYLYFIDNPNQDRITGLTEVSITFGNMVMTIFVFLLVSLSEDLDKRKKILVIFSLFCAVVSWSFTMTKGSLIGLLFVLIYMLMSKSFNKNKIYIFIGSIIIMITLFFSPMHRALDIFVNDIKNVNQQELTEVHKDSNISFSTKERIFLLVNAKEMIINNPITGVGYQNFKKHIAEKTYIDDRKYGMAHHDHAHNDFIDLWAKIGVFGFIALIYFYVINLKIFLKASSLRKNNYFEKIGVVTLLSQLGFMLTQTQLAHHQPTLFFLVILIVMSSQIIKNDERSLV